MEASSHDRWREDSAIVNGGGMEAEDRELCCHRVTSLLSWKSVHSANPRAQILPTFSGHHTPSPRLLSVLLLSTRPRVKHLQWRWLQGHLGHPARHRCGREVLIQRRGRNSGFLVRSVDTQGLRDAKALGTFLSSKT